jgi:RNA polymerase sigma factor
VILLGLALKLESEVEMEARPEAYVERIQQGQEELRHVLIERYKPFIMASVSRIINTSAEGRDEYSVGLSAFSEAVNCYDPEKQKSFLGFCDLVINRRIIDHIRKNRKHDAVYPFTYFEADGNQSVIEKTLAQNPGFMIENTETREEILEFQLRLKNFGITLADLVKCAPRHIDSKLLCIMLARRVTEDPELIKRLEKTGQLPIGELLKRVHLSRKAIENNRRYVIALCIAMTSGMEIIKGYIRFIEEGVKEK